jgi:hypothetical protein
MCSLQHDQLFDFHKHHLVVQAVKHFVEHIILGIKSLQTFATQTTILELKDKRGTLHAKQSRRTTDTLRIVTD